jgi:uncharacterized membrane protein YccC
VSARREGIVVALRRRWQRVTDVVSWTPPTSTEIGTVAKSGLAAGLSWWVARMVTDVPDPVLASLTAVVVVQVSVRASVLTALQRSFAVVLGVLLALAIGDALGLNGFTVGLLVAVSLGIAELVLQLPPAAARQVPLSVLVVLTAVTSNPVAQGWQRALGTLLGAAIGVVVSLLLPASRLVDARQTLDRLGANLGDVLDEMGKGLEQSWSTDQTEEWRRRARSTRHRLVRQAEEAVGNGRETARWNVRDRRHIATLGRYEDVMPRLERTAIGVWAIARGLDDHARLSGTTHLAMPAMGHLLVALGGAVRTVVDTLLGRATDVDLAAALDEVRVRRERSARGAYRRAEVALEHDPHEAAPEGEWLGFVALLVQVDRIVADLSVPLPT